MVYRILQKTIEQESILLNYLTCICEKVRPIIKDAKLQDFTNHDIEHSKRVISKIESLVSMLREPLGPYSSFILLSSAYLHDVGMQYPFSDNVDEIRKNHHIFSAEMIIGSVQKKEKYPDLGVPEAYAPYIALVSKGHRKVNLEVKEYSEPILIYEEKVNLSLLSALLRFADELDIDSRRVNMERLKIETKMPENSRIHWWKHYYVQGCVVENRLVQIQFRFPKNTEGKEFPALIKTYVKKYMEDEYDSLCNNILWPAGVILSFKLLPDIYNMAKESMMPQKLINTLKDTLEEKAPAIRPLNWEQFLSSCRTEVNTEKKDVIGVKFRRDLYVRREIEGEFKKFVKSNKSCFIIRGESGTGKTNLFCQLVEDYMPAIILTLSHLPQTVQEMEKMIVRKIPHLPKLSVNGNFELIDGLVKSQGEQFIIFFDGEYTTKDVTNYKDILYNFLNKHSDHAFKFCITCRGTYGLELDLKDWSQFLYPPFLTFSDDYSLSAKMTNFTEGEFKEARRKYFDSYHIILGGEGLLEEAKEKLKHPMLLSLFSEVRKGYVNGPIPDIRILELCKEYWDKKIAELTEGANENVRKEAVNFIFEVSKYMRGRRTGSIKISEIQKITKDYSSFFKDKILPCVYKQGILIEELRTEGEVTIKKVKFMFEEFKEYLMARKIIDEELEWHKKQDDEILNDLLKLREGAKLFETTYGIIEYIILLAEIEKNNNLHLKMLERLAESGDSRWQRIACLSIPKFNKFDPKMSDLLKTLAHNKDVMVLETTGQTLGALSEIIPEEVFEILSMLVHNSAATVKSISVQSLLRLPSNYTDKIIPFLLEAAGDYRWEVCKELALHLLTVKNNTKAFVPVLKILSANRYYQVREATAEVLKSIGPRILPEAIQLLKNMCKAASHDPALSTVISALATLSNYDKETVLSIFDELSKSPKEDLRKAIVEHVDKVDRYVARKIWDMLSEDPSTMVRMSVWQAMVKNDIIKENDSNALQSILIGRHVYRPGILFTEIKKRDGAIVPFDISKISNAIFKAAKVVAKKEEKEVDPTLSEDLANRVVQHLYEKKGEHTPAVEEVQDVVERILIKHGFSDTAKVYILYRKERDQERKRKKKNSGN
jgi:hypothetical protein